MRWGAELQRLLAETDTSSDDLLVLENQVERWDGVRLKASARPMQLDDGTIYQSYMYSS